MEENQQERKICGNSNKFEFPIVPMEEREDCSEFEFGSVSPVGSPNSPADKLFFNGKLLPHVFPVQPGNGTFLYSRSTSRTSSISSKDSLMSSRSNSTNSRSSNCSSARTSVSDQRAPERRMLNGAKGAPGERDQKGQANKRPVLPPQYCVSSQRWQFIAPAPVLRHQGSCSRKNEIPQVKEPRTGRKNREKTEKRSWFGKRMFKSFVSACKECHAIS